MREIGATLAGPPQGVVIEAGTEEREAGTVFMPSTPPAVKVPIAEAWHRPCAAKMNVH